MSVWLIVVCASAFIALAIVMRSRSDDRFDVSRVSDRGRLSVLTRRILDEVIGQGDRTMRDRAIILPNRVVVHASPFDVDILNQDRGSIERDVSAAIAASGGPGRWVSAGDLRIVKVIADDDIPAGRPLVQRTGTPGPAGSGRTLPLPPESLEWAPLSGYELVSVDGVADAVEVPADGGYLGRDPRTCEMVVPTSTVSRRHAQLLSGPEGFTVRDLASANGTTVNGSRVDRAALNVGDVLGLGRKVRLELRRTIGTPPAVPRVVDAFPR